MKSRNKVWKGERCFVDAIKKHGCDEDEAIKCIAY